MRAGTGLNYMTVYKGGTTLCGSGVQFSDLLAHVPAGVGCLIAVICGNDVYCKQRALPFNAAWEVAVDQLSLEMKRKSRFQFAVMGGSSAVWQYERFMPVESMCRYDVNCGRLASRFLSNGVWATSGEESLLGLELADSIGHVSV